MKRTFTLLETLIALALCTFLFSTLFGLQYHTQKQRDVAKKILVPIKQERYAEQRLNNILPKATLEGTLHGLFCSNKNSLVFTFDKGPDQDPLLANVVLARLYLDEVTHSLVLAIWPHKEDHPLTPVQTFVLLDDVSSLEMRFYAPPDVLALPVADTHIKNPQPKPGWHKEWELKYDLLPAMIKLTTRRGNRDVEFAFDLHKQIVYPGKSSHEVKS
ncbi:MAG: DUF1494 domain-containing protein [Chlamydiales bacterium]